MNYLMQGMESEKRVKLMLSLTKISSEPVKDALLEHLARGNTEAASAALNGVTQSNFNRALAKLNEVAGIIEKIKEIDWAKRKQVINDIGVK